MSHSRKKTPSSYMETRRRGHEKNPGREMPPQFTQTPFAGIPSFSGDRASRPREGTFPRPALAAAFFGRGHLELLCGAAVARSRGAGAPWGIYWYIPKPKMFRVSNATSLLIILQRFK